MTDLEALTLTLWGEARGEPIEGKLAVAAVIRNRVLRGAPVATYVSICTAKAQFSAWTEEVAQMKQAAADFESGHLSASLELCEEIARATIAGLLLDPTDGDLNYITRDLYDHTTPVWAKGKPIKQFGNQVFFTA